MSVLDPIAVALAAGSAGRPVRFMALSELFEHGVVGWTLRVTRQVPLRRGLGDWDAIENVADVVRTGSLAAMSPEGTVGGGEALQPGQRGAARIALVAGVPIVPVGVWGTQRRWPRAGLHRRPPLRPVVGVVVGPAIQVQGDARSRPDVLALTDRLMFALTVKNAHTRIYLTEGTQPATANVNDPRAANFWRLDNANQAAALRKPASPIMMNIQRQPSTTISSVRNGAAMA